MLLVDCENKVGYEKYEDFANICYGKRMSQLTGWLNLTTLLGFVVSYIVFVKNLIPHIIS